MINTKLLEYFINFAENGMSWSISEGTYPQEEIKRMEDEFKTMREQLEKKFQEIEEINDIFISIINAAKILGDWQYQEITIWDKDDDDREYKVYIVNENMINQLKELKLIK